jgi:acyl-coenzyme A synthetase/AMP-(fatty) acid ligase
MRQTDCIVILHAAEVLPVVNALVASSPGIKCAEIPSFQEMLDSQSPVYPFNRSFADAKNEPIVILHSSGSTGKHQYPHLEWIIDRGQVSQSPSQ